MSIQQVTDSASDPAIVKGTGDGYSTIEIREDEFSGSDDATTTDSNERA